MTQPHRLPANAAQGFGGALLDRSRPLRFRLNGQLLEGYQGDTVLSAALAAGLRIVSRPGEEPVALDEEFAPPILQLHGRQVLPMERTPARDGIDYRTYAARPESGRRSVLARVQRLLLGPGRRHGLRFEDAANTALPWLDAAPEETLGADLVVVGAGIAGLSAAVTAAKAGKSVIVVERRQRAGGVAGFFGAVDNEPAPEARVAELQETLATHGGRVLLLSEAIRVIDGTVIVHRVIDEGAMPRGRMTAIRAGHVVLATGMRERLPIFAGNRLPGVVGALSAWQRATSHGVWQGRQAVVATPHSAAYRLALHAADAGIAVKRIVDSRIHPHSRFIDFCKASGITLASGQIVSSAKLPARSDAEVTVSFAANGPSYGQPPADVSTSQLVAAGSWQPDLTLWLSAGGDVRWDAERHMLVAAGEQAGLVLAGSAAGWISSTAAVGSGRAAVSKLIGRAAPKVEDKLISELFETADDANPLAPAATDSRGASYLGRGRTLATRQIAADGGISLMAEARALSLGEVAAAVALGVIDAAGASVVAQERCVSGIEIADTGWRVEPQPDPEPTTAAPVPPPWLDGRFGSTPVFAHLSADDSRRFSIGALVFGSSDASRVTAAIGVIYAAHPEAGGIAMLSRLPERDGAHVFVRDAGGLVRARVATQLDAPG